MAQDIEGLLKTIRAHIDRKPEFEAYQDYFDTLRLLGAELMMRPYYMYRQKYMRGNLENVGYALPNTECIYNIDMMEETTSIMAHGAGADVTGAYRQGGGVKLPALFLLQ